MEVGVGLGAEDPIARCLCPTAEYAYTNSETAYRQVFKLYLENGDGGVARWSGAGEVGCIQPRLVQGCCEASWLGIRGSALTQPLLMTRGSVVRHILHRNPRGRDVTFSYSYYYKFARPPEGRPDGAGSTGYYSI